jgi:acyl carrier protein
MSMELNEFIRKIEAEIEDIEPGTLTPAMNYNQIPNWSSMHFLIIIALCDTEYSVKLTGEDLRSTPDLASLYSLVKSRMS